MANFWFIMCISNRIPKVNVRFLLRYLDYPLFERGLGDALLYMVALRIRYEVSVKLDNYMLISVDRVVV